MACGVVVLVSEALAVLDITFVDIGGVPVLL